MTEIIKNLNARQIKTSQGSAFNKNSLYLLLAMEEESLQGSYFCLLLRRKTLSQFRKAFFPLS